MKSFYNYEIEKLLLLILESLKHHNLSDKFLANLLLRINQRSNLLNRVFVANTKW